MSSLLYLVDELSTNLQHELDKQMFASATGLLSKSADSDTLVVDLLSDSLTDDLGEKLKNDNYGTEERLEENQPKSDVKHDGTEDQKDSTDDESKDQVDSSKAGNEFCICAFNHFPTVDVLHYFTLANADQFYSREGPCSERVDDVIN